MKKADAMVIDYDATLQAFFQDVDKFLERRTLSVSGDDLEHKIIVKARESLKKIAANPDKYADYNARVLDEIEPDPRAFMVNAHDNSVYLIVKRVLNNIKPLKSQFDWHRESAEKALLQARREMQYKLSKCLFKDITFVFKPEHKFAVKKEITH